MSTPLPKVPFAWINRLPRTYYSNVYTFVGGCVSTFGLVLIVLAFLFPGEQSRTVLIAGFALLLGFPGAEMLRTTVEKRRSRRVTDRLDALRLSVIEKHGNAYERAHFLEVTGRLHENANRVLVRVFMTCLFENAFEEVQFPFWKDPPRVSGVLPPEVETYTAMIKQLLPDADVYPVIGEATDECPFGVPALEVNLYREQLGAVAFVRPKVASGTDWLPLTKNTGVPR